MKNFIAHRGLKINNDKENTINSFINAIKSDNYQGFECDIRETKDGIFIINHNSFTNLKLIKNSLYKELKKDFPKLTDVLNLKTNKIILLEIKDPNININSLIKILNKYQHLNIYLMSFYNKVIKKLNIPNKTYKLGVLNYVLNSEKTYENYDFICLLESVYTKKLDLYFRKKNIEIFLYGIHNEETYNLNNLYFITDKII